MRILIGTNGRRRYLLVFFIRSGFLFDSVKKKESLHNSPACVKKSSDLGFEHALVSRVLV